MRVLRRALELVWTTFGFVATKEEDRELLNKICEGLFERHGAESGRAKGSEEYFDKCLELVLRDRRARELFYWIGVKHLWCMLLAPFKIALEKPEFKEEFENAVHALKEAIEVLEEEEEEI